MALKMESEERRCRTQADLRVMGLYSSSKAQPYDGSAGGGVAGAVLDTSGRGEYQVTYLLNQMQVLGQAEKKVRRVRRMNT